jgi:hypothetical protein
MPAGKVCELNLLRMKKCLAILIFLVMAMVMACEPEPDQHKLYDQLVVSTNYDPAANFGSYFTYVISTDTIGFYSNQTSDTILTHTDSDLVRPIIDKVKQNLNVRGFEQVELAENPDLGINISIVNNLNLFQQIVDPGYYSNYYGYGSYYYYPYIETYVENTGTLVLEIIDLKNRNANNQVKVVWAAYMGDLISTVDRLKQTEEGIDQAFAQSPYVDSNL